MRKRTSPIWKISKEELIEVIDKSNTISEVLSYFKLTNKGGNYRTLHSRVEYEKIDISGLRKRAEIQRTKPFRNFEKIPLKQVLVENSSYNRSSLKKRLLKENIIKNVCAICGQKPEWKGMLLVLVLDHINGKAKDHRLFNLRMLCPNCNSQQSTFAGRNHKREKIKYFCKCGNQILQTSKVCVSCAATNRRKVKNRPSKEQLLKEIAKSNYCAVGRKYNVSDKAIRKWLKN